jgi:hypothetical protein
MTPVELLMSRYRGMSAEDAREIIGELRSTKSLEILAGYRVATPRTVPIPSQQSHRLAPGLATSISDERSATDAETAPLVGESRITEQNLIQEKEMLWDQIVSENS